MATNYVQDSTPTNPFGVGYYQQMVDYSKKLIAEREADQIRLDAIFNATSRAAVNDAKKAYQAAVDSGADAATVAALKNKADDLAFERSEASANAERNLRLLTATQDGLIKNEAALNNAIVKSNSIPQKDWPPNPGTDPAPLSNPNPSVVATPPNEQTPSEYDAPQTFEPLRTPDGDIEGEGDAGTGLEEPPPTFEWSGGASEPYDELGNLNPGWEQDELGQAYYVGTDLVIKREPEPIPPGPNADAQSDPYDELGNLNPGWNVDEQGIPYWVGFGDVKKESSTTIPYLGPSRDDDGNLMPGWEEGEFGDQYVGDGYVSAATQASADQSRAAATAAQKKESKPPAASDWRVRISLAPGAKYFYAGDTPGILKPLASTKGVVFPYMPTISVSYNAKYDSQPITHSNYNFHNYTSSSVDQISISGEFTAQDTTEAAYMLAVIHFFRSATKMFYGKDSDPNRGTPPPLLYLSGHGNYQFDNHPMVLTSFAYSLPVDVDYINAYPDGASALNTMPLAPYKLPNIAKPSPMQRLTGSGLQPGGKKTKLEFASPKGSDVITRVPTKISISLTFLPVVTRNAITNKFSLKEYASGKLLRGSQNPGTGGGIW